MPLIKSRSNPKVKQARALRNRKTRQQTALFLVEGIRHVGEAFESGANIQSIFYAPDQLASQFALRTLEELISRGIPVYETTSEVFDSIAGKENPQGILAVVHQFERQLDDLNPSNFDWGAAVVSPQDPGNIGAILRTIDAIGASGLIIIDKGADPFHPSAVRASMGALFWKSITQTSFDEFSDWITKYQYTLYGSSAQGDRDYRDIKHYQKPCVLLMGSERSGLEQKHRELCEFILRLPVKGRTSSLNLAVAAGILLYAMKDSLQ